MLKALTYEEYVALHPKEIGGLAELANPKEKELHPVFPGIKLIRSGFLLFTPETAPSWGGPFEGGYAVFVLYDWTRAKRPLNKYNKNKDGGRYILDIYEEHMEITKRKIAAGTHKYLTHYHLDHPIKELPIELKLYGNDDTSWAKSYKNIDEALQELELFESNQPLEYHIVYDFKFYFTN